MPIIECEYCGNKFYKKPSHIAKTKHSYCSTKCCNIAKQKTNNIIIKDNHAEMIIKKHDKELVILFDIEDLDKVNQAKWMAVYDKTINDYYITAHERTNHKDRKTLRLHNIIMNTPENMECDHINRNPRDNRKCNLRNVEPMINKQNKGFYKNNKSGYKYIHWNKETNKWRIEIKRNNIKTFYGAYKNLEDAVIKRNEILLERRIIV